MFEDKEREEKEIEKMEQIKIKGLEKDNNDLMKRRREKESKILKNEMRKDKKGKKKERKGKENNTITR